MTTLRYSLAPFQAAPKTVHFNSYLDRKSRCSHRKVQSPDLHICFLEFINAKGKASTCGETPITRIH